MESNVHKTSGHWGDQSSSLHSHSHSDAAGLWFSLAVIFAFVAAGVIVYSAAMSDSVAKRNSPAVARLDQPAPKAFGWPH